MKRSTQCGVWAALAAAGACSAPGWGRVARSTEVSYSEMDWGDDPTRDATSVGVSLHPFEYIEPPPAPTYIVERPDESFLDFRWPLEEVSDEPGQNVVEWYEDEIKVVSVAAAIATAVLAVWKREKITNMVTGRKRHGDQ